MANELLVRQTMRVFSEIAVKLINPAFRFSKGGAAIRTMSQALDRLDKKYGSLSRARIVDYCICAAYRFKDRENAWTINQVFGPKSLERFDSNKGRVYYENRWLMQAGLTRALLMEFIIDRSQHPQAQYVFMPMEENTKARMLNQRSGYIICQSSTLGWSPESASCQQCKFINECKIETHRKFPEIFRLRMEYDI